MSRFFRLLLLIGLALLLAACEVTNPTDTQKNKPTAPPPAAGKAVLTGQVILASSGKPLPDGIPVRLAQVHRKGTDGAFVLDLGSSPGAFSKANGYFTIVDIPPAEYLLVVGQPEDNNYVIYHGADGKPYTYKVEAGKTVDLKVVKVDYTP